MNPYRLKDVFNYLTSNNQLLKRKLKLGTDEIPIPPKRDDVKTIEAINRFNKANPRVDTTNLKPLSVKHSNVRQSNVNEPNEGVIQGAFDTATREAQSEGYPAPNYEKFKARYLKKNMKADGGMLVQPSDDGSRPGYAKPIDNPLTKNQKQKVINAFPDIKFDFDTYPKYGVKKYLTGDDRKTNKDYTKVDRFTKKGFTLEQGEGLSTRGKVYQDRGKRLSVKDQEKIKSLFELPPGEEWDFKTHKYGIKQAGRENLLVRMARVVKEKKPWKIAADVGSPKGWMLLQMNRVYENEKKAKVKNPTYKPIFKKINEVNRIIGFKDNTAAGQGKTYYGLDKYSKKNATDWAQHGDYKQNVKLFDIAKRSNNAPNEVITGLLNDKGFKGKVTLNNLVNFLSGVEGTSPASIKNAIVRHHNSGVAFGSATNDLSLTTQIINKKIVEAEKRIRSGSVLSEDVQLLKNNNIYVRGNDGKLYGSGKKSAIGQFKQIESDVASAIESGKNFKGEKFKITDIKKYVAALGGGTCSVFSGKKAALKADGGRIGLQEGTPNIDDCFKSGSAVINSGKVPVDKADDFAQLLKRAGNIGRGIMKFGIIPEALYATADSLIRVGMGDTFTEAGLRATDYLLPGDQTKAAEISKVSRVFGDETGELVGRTIDYKNQLAKIQSLEDQKANFENLSGGGEFDYIGDLTGDVNNVEKQLIQARNDLDNKFKISEAEQLFAESKQDDAYDASKANSFFTRLKAKYRDSSDNLSDVETLAAPEKTQMQLNLNMLPNFTETMKDPEIKKDLDYVNLPEKNIREYFTTQGTPEEIDSFLQYQKDLKDAYSLNNLSNTFGKEQVYGTQGTFGGEPVDMTNYKPNPNRFEGFKLGMASGGIASLTDTIPPKSGPTPHGLPSLMKRGIKIKE